MRLPRLPWENSLIQKPSVETSWNPGSCWLRLMFYILPLHFRVPWLVCWSPQRFISSWINGAYPSNLSHSMEKIQTPAILHGKNHGFPQLFPYINPLIGSKRPKIIQNWDLYWRLRLHFVHLVCSPPGSCVDTYTCMALDQAKASAMADSIKVELNVLAPGWRISLTCYLWGILWVVLPCDFGLGSMFQQFLARTNIRMRVKFINVW